MSIAVYPHSDHKAEFPTYKDEIAGHYSRPELDLERCCRLARIRHWYIERGIDSDVDEYGGDSTREE